MAVARSRFDNGDSRVLYDSLYQPCAAARDKQVDIAVCFHPLDRKLSVGVAYELDYIRIESCAAYSLAHKLDKYHI